MPAKKLTHFDSAGRAVMVDVAAKDVSHRVARASGEIRMLPSTLSQIGAGTANKGDVLGVARIAGIQAAKRTSELIPLCHPLPLTKISVDFELHLDRACVECVATVETLSRTGVEMEALTAVTVSLLTIYDMCKAVDRGMRLEAIVLQEKRGGRSGRWAASGGSP
jgi:cyclic pyranopterin phosphate synthase